MTSLETVLPPPPSRGPGPTEWDPPWGRVELPPTARLAVLSLVVGVLVDVAIRSGTASVGGALAFAVAAVVLITSGRVVQREARALVALAPVFGGCLALRTSVWLVPFDFMVACGLLVAGAAVGRRGSVFDLPPVRIAGHALAAVAHSALGASFLPLVRVKGARATRWLAVCRGLLLGAPIVALFWVLLVNADVVFASFFHVDIDVGDCVVHLVLVVFGAWSMLAVLRLASSAPPWEPDVPRLRLGATEATVIASAVVALFTLFAAAQLLAATGAADHVLRTEGLTYAEYARSGFFQLLWVAGLTIAGLVGLRSLTREADRRAGRRITVLSLMIVALTMVIVGVAIHRMMLYEDAYGLTMLRLYVVVFAAWLGFALLLVAALLAGLRRDRSWFAGVASLSLLAVLLALNIVNPEAVVARHNLTRPAGATPVDDTYLTYLSDDAIPTIVDLAPTLDPSTRARVIAAVGCAGRTDSSGPFAANLATWNADDARATLCAAST